MHTVHIFWCVCVLSQAAEHPIDQATVSPQSVTGSTCLARDNVTKLRSAWVVNNIHLLGRLGSLPDQHPLIR